MLMVFMVEVERPQDSQLKQRAEEYRKFDIRMLGTIFLGIA